MYSYRKVPLRGRTSKQHVNLAKSLNPIGARNPFVYRAHQMEGIHGSRKQKKYTSKQKQKEHDIEKGYKKRGVSSKEA